MARPVLLSNGRLHVGINQFGQVHDFYFPYVGLENHCAAKQLRHRIGVFVDGRISWVDDGNWEISHTYLDGVLVSHIIASQPEIGVRLEFDDCVDYDSDVFIRNIHIINLADTDREIKLYLHQVFTISDSHLSDTIQYLPDEHAIVHYKGRRAFIVNARHGDGRRFDEHSIGLFGIEGKIGTYCDAEDGHLEGNGVEHGKVDSVVGLYSTVKAKSSARVHYWISAAETIEAAQTINENMLRNGVIHELLTTAKKWSEWSKPTEQVASKLPEKYQSALKNSLLLIKAAIDQRGAVIASTDTTMLNYSRDSYAYCWPRDAVYVLWPLLRLGYRNELENFFEFCASILHTDGYLGHKYQPDGALGSSWHPFVHPDRSSSPPIQTDETAGVLFLLGQYYARHNDPAVLEKFYTTLISPMANFLSGFVGDDKLPLPSYDLWEEKYLTTTYTTALTYAALEDAAKLAEASSDPKSAVRWRTAAEDMREARDIFYDEDQQFFIKGFVDTTASRQFDRTIDSSSFYGAYMFGYFDMQDPRVVKSYETYLRELVVDENMVMRYKSDIYHRTDSEYANPWPVCTMWRAQYEFERGNDEVAHRIIEAVHSLMLSTGALAEQYEPHGNRPRSVLPLTWSQAEFVNALLDATAEGSHGIS